MSQDKELTEKMLDAIWQNDVIPVLNTEGNKYFIFSDSHLGDGKDADDFHKNEKTLESALEFYKKEGYRLILLGDIEELWQFDQEKVVNRYGDSIYKKMKNFGDACIYRVFGNHDIDWCTFIDPAKNNPLKCDIAIEALKMKVGQSNTIILLVHGHQGSIESDKANWSSRFWVRFLKPFEKIGRKLGVYGNPSTAKTKIKKNYEGILYSWAKRKKVLLICGHSHRAIFSAMPPLDRWKKGIAKLKEEIRENRKNKKLVEEKRQKIKELRKKIKAEKWKKRKIASIEPEGEPLPFYFNTGCATYRKGITGIEIADDWIKLVKWNRDTQKAKEYEKKKLSEICTIVGPSHIL